MGSARLRSQGHALSIAIAVAAAIGCQQQVEEPSTRSRVQAVAPQKPAMNPREWCDVMPKASAAPAFRPPPVVRATGTRKKPVAELGQTGRWAWWNFWASWCKPCVRELPSILAFGRRLREESLPVDNWFLSLDEDPAEMKPFLGRHAELREERSFRTLNADRVQAWLPTLGLSADTTLPVNMLVDPNGRVRCIRTGSVAEGDYDRVRTVVRALAGE